MPLRTGTPLPELTGATEWVNGEVCAEDLKGRPVLVHFWAKSCHICHDNMPTVQRWQREYADRGLQVVAVHMPRQPEDTNREAVCEDITALGLQEPCAIDNLHRIGERFQNQFWPAYFLFDAEGNLRSRTAGNAGLNLLEGALKRLMDAEPALAGK